MLPSRILSVSIARPFRTVYEFVVDPRNFTQWATTVDSEIIQLNETDWVAEIPEIGRRVIRFTPRNPYGVLDYRAFREGELPGPVTPARLYPNGDGADLTLTRFKPEGVTQERFESECVWMLSDLMRLKTLLEG
jgi:hypothetical protein